MKRRSFFGVLFSGLLTWRFSRHSKAWGASGQILSWRYWAEDYPRYRFGFTGFKPADAFHYHPIEGGRYKPGAPITMAGGPMSVPITYEPRYYEVAVADEYFQSAK